MKTSELKDAALDWAVAKCEGSEVWAGETVDQTRYTETVAPAAVYLCDDGEAYSPSTDWAQGGPIIDREKIATSPLPANSWRAYAPMGTRVLNGREIFSWEHKGNGPTPLIAAMRCYVASKLGDEVEIPKELT